MSSDIFSGAYQLEEAKHDGDRLPDSLERNEVSNQQDMDILELNVSKFTISNCRTESTGNRQKLDKHLNLFRAEEFLEQNEFPFPNGSSKAKRISPLFEKNPDDAYLYKNPVTQNNRQLSEPPSNSAALQLYYTMTTDSLKKVSYGKARLPLHVDRSIDGKRITDTLFASERDRLLLSLVCQIRCMAHGRRKYLHGFYTVVSISIGSIGKAKHDRHIFHERLGCTR